MQYLLDTNICIYFLNRTSERLISQFKNVLPLVIKLSTISVAELFYGAEKSNAKKKNWAIVENFVSTFEIIPFDEKSSKIYPKIRASLEKSGNPIGPMDLLIASISLANNFNLVTNNLKEFKRVKGLKVENWV
jgi:tRNA(fMet)-specific endonuclease VapC